MERDNIDKVLNSLLKSDPSLIKGLDNIEAPDMEDAVGRVILRLSDEKKVKQKSEKRKAAKSVPRRLAAIAGILVLSFVLSFFYEIPTVKAIKHNMVNMIVKVKNDVITIIHTSKSDLGTDPYYPGDDAIVESISLEQARKKLPFHLLIPSYIPESYKYFDTIYKTYEDGTRIVEQIYKNNENVIKIRQTNGAKDDNMISYSQASINTVKIVQTRKWDISLIINKNMNTCKAMWYYGDFRCELIATLSEDEVLRIIEGLE